MKRYLVYLIATVLLVGCMAAPVQPGSTAPSASQPDILSSQSASADFPRIYVDARGKEITLEKKPARIAVTTWMITEKLLAMDVPPIAADTVGVMSEWASMKDYFEKYQVEDLGTEVNLEKLLEAKPDLILATSANEAIYDQLEAIAPVVVFDIGLMFGDWQDSIREVAKVVGSEPAAEEFIDGLMEQITQAKQKLSLEGKTVAFLRLWNKTIYSMGVGACAAYYHESNGLGLQIPQGWPEEIGVLSLEALTQINPDYIFVSTQEDSAYMKDLTGNSVWKSLTAVKENHLYTIDLSGLSGGALAAQYGVEAVLAALTK